MMGLVHPVQRLRTSFRADVDDERTVEPSRLVAADLARSGLILAQRPDDVRLGRDAGFSVRVFVVVLHVDDIQKPAVPSLPYGGVVR